MWIEKLMFQKGKQPGTWQCIFIQTTQPVTLCFHKEYNVTSCLYKLHNQSLHVYTDFMFTQTMQPVTSFLHKLQVYNPCWFIGTKKGTEHLSSSIHPHLTGSTWGPRCRLGLCGPRQRLPLPGWVSGRGFGRLLLFVTDRGLVQWSAIHIICIKRPTNCAD